MMSNLGLEKKLSENSISVIRTAVGDRYIKEEIMKKNLSIGGEQSGHIIMKDYGLSGDGMISALQILSILKDQSKPSSELLKVFDPIPQKLINYQISDPRILELKETKDIIYSYEQKLTNDGRIFIRMSGTEPLLRVMIECTDQKKLDKIEIELNSYFSKF